jgi:membrane-bound lytic murein transglycosylase A
MARTGQAASRLAALLILTVLAACASPKGPVVPGSPASHPTPAAPGPTPLPAVPAPTPEPAVPGPPPPPLAEIGSPASLPGWAKEDHLAALHAFQAGCGLAKKSAEAALCRQARLIVVDDGDIARRFFENNFAVEPIHDAGLLTAYFSPEYEAHDAPNAEFRMPVRPQPADLKAGRPYADRATIEARAPNDAIAWMKPEDLFFLQIQGSGTLIYPDGRRLKAIFAAHNSLTFKGIANPMRDKGLLAANNTSGEAIRGWLASHRGEQANAIMRLNPRYVFFSVAPDDGNEPTGAAGLPLPPGHSVAIDPSQHGFGELIWIDGQAPTLNGAFPVYQRLVVTLDTGGAIKGQVRADLYLGRGDAAGREAGRVRHALRMYKLVPLERSKP